MRNTCMGEHILKKVSIIIPCLNESRNIVRCLDAIGRQTYPHELIEVLVADGLSTDGTRNLISQWNDEHDIEVSIVDNDRVVAEFGTAEALKVARGEFIYLMGCDEVMAQEEMIETFVEAFDILPGIAGVEQEFVKIPGGSIANNYLAVIHINDPLARDIAVQPKQLQKVERDGKTYREFEFFPGYPAKLLFQRDMIEEFIGADTFEEGQVMLKLALDGRNRMAMVDGYGVYHYNITSLRQYFRRCAKIALKHTTRIRERETWVSHTGKRIYLFALLHLTFIYPLVFSLVQVVRKREPLWLLHAPIAFMSTAIYGLNLAYIKLTGKKAW